MCTNYIFVPICPSHSSSIHQHAFKQHEHHLGTSNPNMQTLKMAASIPTDSSTQNIIKSHENQDQAPLGLDLPHATLRAEKQQ